MLPPLRTLLVSLWVACLAGAVVIAGLVLGQYSWTTFFLAGIIGLLVGIPAGLANWVWLRPDKAQRTGVLGQEPPRAAPMARAR